MPYHKKRGCTAFKQVMRSGKRFCPFPPGYCWTHFRFERVEPASCPEKDSLWSAVVKQEVETLLLKNQTHIAYVLEESGRPWNIHESLGRIKSYCTVSKDLVQELKEPAYCPEKDSLWSAVVEKQVQALLNEMLCRACPGATR